MNVPPLKLLPRLLLASLVPVAAALLHQLARWAYPDGGDILGYLWYSWVPPFFDVAFALLVLAPFVTARGHRWIRILGLILVTAFVYFAVVFTVVHTLGALDRWIRTPYLQYVSVIPTALLATMVLAGATAWLSPLRVSRRYWLYAAIAGLVTGFSYLSVDFVAAYTREYGSMWEFYLPFWIWPVATCVAIYCGRDIEGTD